MTSYEISRQKTTSEQRFIILFLYYHIAYEACITRIFMSNNYEFSLRFHLQGQNTINWKRIII